MHLHYHLKCASVKAGSSPYSYVLPCLMLPALTNTTGEHQIPDKMYLDALGQAVLQASPIAPDGLITSFGWTLRIAKSPALCQILLMIVLGLVVILQILYLCPDWHWRLHTCIVTWPPVAHLLEILMDLSMMTSRHMHTRHYAQNRHSLKSMMGSQGIAMRPGCCTC